MARTLSVLHNHHGWLASWILLGLVFAPGVVVVAGVAAVLPCALAPGVPVVLVGIVSPLALGPLSLPAVVGVEAGVVSPALAVAAPLVTEVALSDAGEDTSPVGMAVGKVVSILELVALPPLPPLAVVVTAPVAEVGSVPMAELVVALTVTLVPS